MTNYAPDRLVGFRALAALLLAVLAFVPVQGALAADDPADPAFWYSTGADGSPRIKVYFYWTTRCEHCRAGLFNWFTALCTKNNARQNG